MRVSKLTPKKALDKAFLKQRPSRTEIDSFKFNLNRLISKINEIEREENQKNHVRDFLRDTYYKDQYELNTKDSKDLVIHLGNTDKHKVGVIIEAKRPSNKSEMFGMDKPNAKALQELVLYYLRERIEFKNDEIQYCIITNIYEWYIIPASFFENNFFRNKGFIKDYEKWRDKQKVASDTRFFYENIAKPFLESLNVEIPCTHFDIRDYEKALQAKDGDDKSLIALFKILSPVHLLKVPFADDSNKLDDKFYKELLHLIGLEEEKVGGKYLIKRKTDFSNSASLIEQTCNELGTVGLAKVKDLKNYGENWSEQSFNISIELCITWVNRILFLKLLEGQLVNYHGGDKSYRFLNIETIDSFKELFKLFHKVLAKKSKDRLEAIQKKYNKVPYLNSSLFEISDLESQTLTINSLDEATELPLYSSSILKEQKKSFDQLPILDYLFKFLNSYDFSSEGTEDIQEDKNRTLINASVLGKVFEKINGYKDGSVFTPGSITMYMSRQSIRLAIIDKFKEKYGWKIKEFSDIKNYLADHKSGKDILNHNKLINSLRICDPSVGSGHFLVSVLNEILCCKAELGILADDKGERFTDHEFTIANDELIVTNLHGDIFQYGIINSKPQSKEAQRLQKALFHEKQKLIENCLFGVDINSNSVKICRLRLWIELLKNAYYKEDDFIELETLPNIDINIKCGNSLLSRFSLDENLTEAFRNKQYNISTYQIAVDTYKNSTDAVQKQELLDLIEKIKKEYTKVIHNTDPKRKKIRELKAEVLLVRQNYDLFGKKMSDSEAETEEKRLNKLIEQRTRELEDIESAKIYHNAFEWRFEFPEVLNEKGEFDGFDVIVGNPPYIESRSSQVDEKLKDEILRNIAERRKKDSVLITRGSDILIYFFELGLCLLKPNGYFSFITQNSWLDTDYGFKFQKFLRKNTEIIGIFDNAVKYFDDSANINTIITLFKGNKGKENNIINFVRFNVGFEDAPYEPSEIASIQIKGKINKFKQDDSILDNIKWGVILNSDPLVIELHQKLFGSNSKIDYEYRIGQGLNLTKEHFVSSAVAEKIGLNEPNLISFYTNDDGAPFCISKTENYLLKEGIYTKEQKKIISEHGIKLTDLKSTREKPNLILPRGVGRFYCADNLIGAYSSSFVEIYLPKNNKLEEYKKFLWLFLNSSVGWLIREISGRKNLGGGMLKAEAIDLKSYPLLFDFSKNLKEIEKLQKNLSKREAENCLVELDSVEHKEIDKLVFGKLNYSESESKKLVSILRELINLRITKSKTKS